MRRAYRINDISHAHKTANCKASIIFILLKENVQTDTPDYGINNKRRQRIAKHLLRRQKQLKT